MGSGRGRETFGRRDGWLKFGRNGCLEMNAYNRLSHSDSMILGASIEAGVTTLYTEDMGAPTTFDGIQLINPFV